MPDARKIYVLISHNEKTQNPFLSKSPIKRKLRHVTGFWGMSALFSVSEAYSKNIQSVVGYSYMSF